MSTIYSKKKKKGVDPKVSKSSAPKKRSSTTVRVANDVAHRVKEGHPWIFESALAGRKITESCPNGLDVVDSEGRFVGRALFDSNGPIVLRVFSREKNTSMDASFLRKAISRAGKWRRELLDIGPSSCFRALNGDSEGVPSVTVDCYGRFLVICAYSEIVMQFFDPLLDALETEWRPSGIYLQKRFLPVSGGEARPGAELVRGSRAPQEVIVNEGRVRFVVDVTAPLGTGLFCDMRLGREAVARVAAGRRVLNCFSYFGAFSVVAAMHGAKKVVSVDLAPRAHTHARRNFAENGISIEDSTYEFITGDAFATIARMLSRGQRFDFVILDPPTFSSGKGRPFTALKDYSELIQAALKVMDKNSFLFVSSNASKLSFEELDHALAQAAYRQGREILITQRIGQPPDYPVMPGFPEGTHLKAFLAVVQ